MSEAIAGAPTRQAAGTESRSTDALRARSAADKALKFAAGFWFVVAVLGQWMFVTYVATFYGSAALSGDISKWNQVMPNGYVAGDTMGNVVVGVHLLLAVLILVGGPLQLVPQIRNYFPRFHRWNGRLYLPAVFLTSLIGLYMVGTRGTVGDLPQHLGISLDALLIMTFAALALRYALARDFRTHRRWALRLFMVVNGVWFFRVGLMLWLLIHQAPVGFDPKSFTGPFLSVLAFADYLLPLAILEIYLRVKDRGGVPARWAMATGLVMLTLAMGAGIFAATMGMWLPRL